MSRAVRWIIGLATAAVLVGAGWWAGRTALESPEDPLAAATPVSYEVEEGKVGRSLTFAAVAEWDLVPVGAGSSVGVVTSALR